jgi:hypothetical protein
VAQVAKDLGISPPRLRRWLTIDDKSSASSSPSGRQPTIRTRCAKRNKRIKLLEQENEARRAAGLPVTDEPAGK